MALSAKLILIILIVSLISDPVLCGRRSRGRSRSSSSSGSRRKTFGSLFSWGSKKKTNTNPQSSYPRQQYKPISGTGQSGGIGGGGFAAPKNNYGTNTGYGAGKPNIGGGGFVAPPKNNYGTNTGYGAGKPNIGGGGFAAPPKNNYGSNFGSNYGSNYGSNFGSKYGSSGFGHYNSMGRFGGGVDMFGRKKGGLFSGGGKKAFALGAAGGFIGGAVAGVAAMETYHRYKMFQSMLAYKMYGGAGFGMGGYGMGYHRPQCFGGCPIGAFCDFGMCRCRPDYDDRYGQCWDSIGSFNNRQNDWNERRRPDFNPFQACSMHETCTKVDMNMICSNTTEKCECRKDMKWNEDTLECQIFMDVDCSDVKDEKPEATSNTGNPEVKETGQAMNLTEYDFSNKNITDLSPNDTLANSQLTKIDVNETSEAEIRRQFCREIKFLSKSYQQPLVERRPENDSSGASFFSRQFGVVIAIISGCCLACFCACFTIKKLKGGDCDGNKYSPPSSPQNGGNNFNMGQPVQMEAPPPQQTFPSYPPAPVPGQPAVPAAPGYAPTQPPPVYNTPYPASDTGSALYPPVGDNPPYPPAAGSAPYPPAPGGVPYPPAADVTSYQAQSAENPAYPSAPSAPGYPTQQPPPYPN